MDTTTQIRPFRIDIAQDELDDLKRRLDHTRLAAPVPGDAADFSRGLPPSYLTELVTYWRTSYDWRAAEAELNSFPQFLTDIDGQTLHFIHLRSPESAALPLLVSHGYPGSVVEFMKLVGPLSDPRSFGGDPADAFHVVIPSLPGFGFSTPLSGPGWEMSRTTDAFAELMDRLGYDRYGAQGGDVGAGIVGRLGATRPDRVVGTHINSDRGALGQAGEFFPLPDDLTDAEREVVEAAQARWRTDRGYLDLQSHQPDTIGASLSDSPAGQLAWIAEKFQAWTNPRASTPDEAVDRDQLLTLVAIYWFTRSGASAARFLYEAAHAQVDWVAPSSVPAGWAVFNTDPVVRRVMDPQHKIAHWSDFAEGGHFPAMEVGNLLVQDIRAFFRAHRA